MVLRHCVALFEALELRAGGGCGCFSERACCAQECESDSIL